MPFVFLLFVFLTLTAGKFSTIGVARAPKHAVRINSEGHYSQERNDGAPNLALKLTVVIPALWRQRTEKMPHHKTVNGFLE